MKDFPVLLNDEFITKDVLSMLEERNFKFVERRLNDYHFKNNDGELVLVLRDDEVLILDRTLGELPFIYSNIRYRKLDEDTVEKCELVADISDNFNFLVITSEFLKVLFRKNVIETSKTVENFCYPEEKIKRLVLDLRVRDGFSILKQLDKKKVMVDKTITKKIRKLGNDVDYIYDEKDNLIGMVSLDSVLLENTSNYHK